MKRCGFTRSTYTHRNDDPRGKRAHPASPTKPLGGSPADRGARTPRGPGGGPGSPPADQLKAKSETNLYPESAVAPPPGPHSPYYPAQSVPNLDRGGPAYDPSIMRNYDPHQRNRWVSWIQHTPCTVSIRVSSHPRTRRTPNLPPFWGLNSHEIYNKLVPKYKKLIPKCKMQSQ